MDGEVLVLPMDGEVMLSLLLQAAGIVLRALLLTLLLLRADGTLVLLLRTTAGTLEPPKPVEAGKSQIHAADDSYITNIVCVSDTVLNAEVVCPQSTFCNSQEGGARLADLKSWAEIVQMEKCESTRRHLIEISP